MHTVRVFTHCTCLCNVCTCVWGFKSYCLVSPLIIHPPAMFFELSVDLKSSVQLVWLTSELKGFICLFIYPSPGIYTYMALCLAPYVAPAVDQSSCRHVCVAGNLQTEPSPKSLHIFDISLLSCSCWKRHSHHSTGILQSLACFL